MVLLVHGFPSKIAALQFEWAWQNPHLSRQAPLASKLLLQKKIEGKTRYKRPSLSLTQRVEILREMLGFEGWRRWPLRISILEEDVAKVWVKVGKKDGIRDVPWEIVGEEVVEEEMENEGSVQERKRDLNLRKLMTLDLDDCNPLNKIQTNVQHNTSNRISQSHILYFHQQNPIHYIHATYVDLLSLQVISTSLSVQTNRARRYFT